MNLSVGYLFELYLLLFYLNEQIVVLLLTNLINNDIILSQLKGKIIYY